jgi:hypothetical protein
MWRFYMSPLKFKHGVCALATSILLTAMPLTSAEAQYYPHRRNDVGTAVAGGVIGGVVGGLAAGALLHAGRPAAVYAPPAYHPPVYAAPEPVYQTEGPYLRERSHYAFRPWVARAPDLEYVPTCYQQRQRVWIDRYT